MHKTMKFSIAVLVLLVLSGCGRKEAPQMISDAATIPQITDLRSEVNVSVLRMDFVLEGDARGVGYQIDRTKIDPYCQCPGLWRRYFEQRAMAKQVGAKSYKMIHMKDYTTELVFRIRAIDVFGNFGPWSKIIHARGIDPDK
ncbi:hypothetical protein JYT23_00640 [Mariprofundus ferrooxydans]|nr:hypothetical protein [Mariprofundus ferrooxydans]